VLILKPRLTSTLHRLRSLGLLHSRKTIAGSQLAFFVLSLRAIEVLARVSKHEVGLGLVRGQQVLVE
jgi:hypothetical protein